MTIDPQQITIENLKLTKDGYSALVLGNTVYAAVGFRDEIDVRDAYLRSKPVEEMTIDEFTRSGTYVKDIPSFVADIRDRAEHKVQLARLGRYEERSEIRTPWGTSQGCTVYGDGVKFHSTSGHGGFKVFSKQNKAIPEAYRNADGWYEEDSEWAKVAGGLPHLFTERELRMADKTLRNWYPDAYEQVNNVVLQPGESRKKDERILRDRHLKDWIVIAASTSDTYEGMVECVATVGGVRGGRYNGVEINPEEKNFLVPKDEYKVGLIGFVIDPDRHQEFTKGATLGM